MARFSDFLCFTAMLSTKKETQLTNLDAIASAKKLGGKIVDVVSRISRVRFYPVYPYQTYPIR